MPTLAAQAARASRPNLDWITRGLWLQAIGYSMACIYGLAMGRLSLLQRGPEAATALAAFGALFLVRNNARLGAWLGLVAVWLQLTADLYRQGSFISLSFILYPLLIAVTGLFLGGRSAVIMGAVAVTVIPGAAILGGVDTQKLLADSGREGLWLLVGILANVASALLTYTALNSYGQVLRDSERERTKYRELFAGAPDGLMSLSDTGLILKANAATAQFLGLPLKSLARRPLREVLAEAGCDPDFNLNEALQLKGLSELKIHRPDGTEAVLELSSQAADDEEGDRLLILRDISQRKLIEQRLDHAQRMEAVGQLAGGIAHDFNNLLTAIGGSAEMIASSSDPEARTFAQLITDAQKRGRTLTQSLLAFARKDRHEPAVIELVDTMWGMEKFVQRVLGEQCRLRFVATEQVHVLVDVAQLEQVVLNLASNARDAMPGGGEVTFRIQPLTAEQARQLGSKLELEEQALLEIADTGQGIPLAMQQRIFEPFFTTKPRGKGTGLGLAAVQGIVVQNHGALALESAPDAGTRFRIFFPAEAAPAQATAAKASNADIPEQPRRLGSKGSILLVDDEALIRQSLSRMLQYEGYTVEIAADADEALRLLMEGKNFLLMITDLAMPGMSGRDLAERVRGIHPHLPIVFMSGYFNEQVPAGAAAPRAGHFLPKPFSRGQLLHALHLALDSHPVAPSNRNGTFDHQI